MAWKKVSSKSVYKNKWMEITEDQVVTDYGKQLTYGVVHKEPFALIIPWDGRHVYLVGQYRYPVDEYSWEFPQGHGEHSSVLETARIELEEETGLMAKTIKEVATFNLAPGHHSQKYYVFLATDLIQGKNNLEPSELGMKVKKVTFDELKRLIADNIITDSPTMAAYGIIMAKHLLD
ncbi:MAG: NUDIX hydrolase [Patescibacteria group bacterium]